MKPFWIKHKVLLIVLAAALVLGLGALALRGKLATLMEAGIAGNTANKGTNQGSIPATKARASLTISTTQAEQGSLAIRLQANGNVAAWQEASVGTESNGLRLAEVYVNVGDSVQKDQLLATFATETVLADVAQAKAALAEAMAASADATSNAERARSLQTTGALSVQQINQYLTAELTAKARVESARAGLQQQELRLKHTRVLAPDSGIVSARSATAGSVVGAGTELFRLIRQGRLEWRAEVTASELARIKPATRVQMLTPTGETVAGKVRMVAPTVDVQSRNALVYVDIATPVHSAGNGLKPGMYVRGEFDLGSSSALTVPQESLVVRDGFHYLFRVGADNRVSQQKVEPGRRSGNRVEIIQGLQAGTVIARTGAGFLSDGDTVRINNAAP